MLAVLTPCPALFADVAHPAGSSCPVPSPAATTGLSQLPLSPARGTCGVVSLQAAAGAGLQHGRVDCYSCLALVGAQPGTKDSLAASAPLAAREKDLRPSLGLKMRSSSSVLVFEDILWAMRSQAGACAAGTGWGGQHDVAVSGDGSQGCTCKTSLSCQHSSAGEEGNLGQARL